MPKTKRPFDWEVYVNGEFEDVLTMTRNEMKEYQKLHPTYILKEIGYSDEIYETKQINNKHIVTRKKRKR